MTVSRAVKPYNRRQYCCSISARRSHNGIVLKRSDMKSRDSFTRF